MTGSINEGLLVVVRKAATENPNDDFGVIAGSQTIKREIYDDGEVITFGQKLVSDEVEIIMGIGVDFEDALQVIIEQQNEEIALQLKSAQTINYRVIIAWLVFICWLISGYLVTGLKGLGDPLGSAVVFLLVCLMFGVDWVAWIEEGRKNADSDASYELKDGINCDCCGEHKKTIQIADEPLKLSVDICKDCLTDMCRNYVQVPGEDTLVAHGQNVPK